MKFGKESLLKRKDERAFEGSSESRKEKATIVIRACRLAIEQEAHRNRSRGGKRVAQLTSTDVK